MSGYVSRKLRDRSGASARRTVRHEPDEAVESAAESKKPADGGKSAKSSTAATKTAERPASKTKTAPKRPSPRPSPGRRPSPAARRIDQAARRKRFSRGLDWTAIAKRLAPVAAVMVVLAGVAVWGAWVSSDTATTSSRLDDATRSAKAAASAIFSYDYRHFDDSVKNGESHAVGKYAKDYVETTKGLKTQVVKLRARVEADVVDIGIVEDDTTCSTKGGKEYSDGVRVLAFVEQYTRNDNIDGTKDSSSRVELCMVQVGDGWKAANANAK
ncbi:MAG TPA: hypothetical protein VE172_02415 [Stackebrandtia sp.]|jgi:Mce-associated membrane protein|uniref:hypothetical protein n=1 Tax=Stackebrandtia sp. TaxID=2023065 RepID=UPI002D6EFDB6|nr:hypothetical protein [Stackebrandtia sp.]HZE37641.1 hypothetical protein [Stackebrandtia sp.]